MESKIWHLPVGSAALWQGGFRKEAMASAHISDWEKDVLGLPWCQTLQFLPVCHRCLSSYYLVLELRGRESKSHVGSLKGTAWDSRNFFHWLNPHWFLHLKIMGTYLEPWAGGPGMGLGLPTFYLSLPNFYPPHIDVGPAHSVSPPLLPVWMDVVSLIL